MKKKQENNLNLKDIKDNERYNVDMNEEILKKIKNVKHETKSKDHIILSKKFLNNYFK